MARKTALIIGGTGLVGKVLTQRMLEMGIQVFLVSRNSQNIAAGAIHIKADINDSNWISACTSTVTEVDFIIYAAYSISKNTNYDSRVNFEGLKEVVTAIKAKKVIFLSSIGVFGSYPQAITYNEELPKTFDTPYQNDKIKAEEFLKNYQSVSSCILYLTIVYSEDSSRVEYYKKLLGAGYLVYKESGEGFYNILHAKDAADAVICCISSETVTSFSNNIVNGEYITYKRWIDLLDDCFGYSSKIKLPKVFSPLFRGPLKILGKLFSFLGFRVPLIIPEPKASIFETKTIFSSEKIAAELGWKPKIKAEDIFRRKSQ